MAFRIVSIGELVVDIFADLKSPGGAPVNFAWHSRLLGDDAFVISAVGRDELGNTLKNYLKNSGVHYLIQENDFPSGKVLVSGTGNEVSYEIIENVAWDHLKKTVDIEQVIKNCDLISCGTLIARSPESRKFVFEALESVTKKTIRYLDVNFRQNFYSKDIIFDFFKRIDVLKVNFEEFKIISEFLNLKGLSEEKKK